MPISLRKLTVAGVAGVAVALAFSSSALACHANTDKTEKCVTSETAKVTWTVTVITGNAKVKGEVEEVAATIDNKAATLDSSPDQIAVGQVIADNGTKTVALTVPKGKTAKVVVKIKWKGEKAAPWTKELTTDLSGVKWEECKVVTPPSSSSSSSAPASSSSSAAAASSSSSAAALPVTGTNVAMMAGGAVILVGAGVALFLAARRRRVRFTTS